MRPVSPRINELLNEALTFELTVVNTYFLNARMLDNWGLPRLGKVFYDLSIGEMKDADAFIQRILMFDGHPNIQKLGSITVGENPRRSSNSLWPASCARSSFSTRPLPRQPSWETTRRR